MLSVTADFWHENESSPLLLSTDFAIFTRHSLQLYDAARISVSAIVFTAEEEPCPGGLTMVFHYRKVSDSRGGGWKRKATNAIMQRIN